MARITNSSVVGIGIQRERDIVKSLEATLKDKGRWQSNGGQIPDGSLGVLALGLGDCRRATVARVAQALAEKLRDHKAQSALLLVWNEREHESYLTTTVTTFCIPVLNRYAYQQWPDSLPLPCGEVRTFSTLKYYGTGQS